MVTARTTKDYIKTNLEIYAPYLDAYVKELRDGGKSEGGVKSVVRYIRSFLARCEPMQPGEITAKIMMDVSVVMESDNISPLSRTQALLHMGRFLNHITGYNPYNEIDPKSREDWFIGHMGEFLFGAELETFIENVKKSGISENNSARRKRIHITTCCRILNKEKDIQSIDQIDEGCFRHIQGLIGNLSDSISMRILYDLDEFLKFFRGISILKSMKKPKDSMDDTLEPKFCACK